MIWWRLRRGLRQFHCKARLVTSLWPLGSLLCVSMLPQDSLDNLQLCFNNNGDLDTMSMDIWKVIVRVLKYRPVSDQDSPSCETHPSSDLTTF